MKIAIAGSSGLIGKALTRLLKAKNHEVIPIFREGENLKFTNLNKEVDAVINLSGASILGFWTKTYRKKILASRIETTRQINEFYKNEKRLPKVFISASAIGYYGSCPNETCLEDKKKGSGFLADVCQKWEAEACKSLIPRVVIFRLAAVLANEGGMYPLVRKLFKSFMGAYLGKISRHFSWVHVDDVARAFSFAIDHQTLHGVYNLCAPESVTEKKWVDTLKKILKRPVFFKAPSWFLKVVLKEASTVVLNDIKACPKKLMQSGFVFDYPSLEIALYSLEQKSP